MQQMTDVIIAMDPPYTLPEKGGMSDQQRRFVETFIHIKNKTMEVQKEKEGELKDKLNKNKNKVNM